MVLKLRILSLIAVHGLILLHIYYFGSDIIGSIDFQEFFHSFIQLGVLNAGTILVILAFLTTLIFGRFFCGWACHFGAVQELSWFILKKLNIHTKTIDSKLVTILPFIILLNYYIAPNVINAILNPWNEIIVKLNAPDIWAFLPGFIIAILTFFIDGFLIVYFLGKKGFCRFLCPWGAFLKFPNSLAFFKVRKTGECTQCHVCTTECPVGIDVSFEINKYNKVTNTNCTSCLNCTYGCPSNALSYSFENPIKENFNFYHYIKNTGSYLHENISTQFKSIRKNDIKILLLTFVFSIAIDGLYGMGHFMAYGIGLIFSFNIYYPPKSLNKINKIVLKIIIIILIGWHATIKFSIWQGYQKYEYNQYDKAIVHLERATLIYPKKIGKIHTRLAKMYIAQNNFDKALYHARISERINPDYESPKQLLEIIKDNLK